MDSYTIYIDEAGRWPLAWPVYVGLIKAQSKHIFSWYKDSKKCTVHVREKLYQKIKKEAHWWEYTAKSSAKYIDRYGISKAIQRAIEKWLQKIFSDAVWNKMSLRKYIDHIHAKNIHLIIDGNYDFGLRKKRGVSVQTIVHGDDLVPQISMASILAKVERDREMIQYDKKYPAYGFAIHKGYGTLRHRQTISMYGYCPLHRQTFVIKSLEKI